MQLKELEFATLFFIEGFLTAKGRVPDSLEIAAALEVQVSEINAILDPTKQSDAFKKALQKKHLKQGFDKQARLRDEALKVSALSELTNPADTRPIHAKLKDLGIKMATFNRWLQDSDYAAQFATVAKRRLSAAVPLVNQAVISSALSGSVQAQKLFLELAGEYTPNQNITIQTITPEIKGIVLLLIEVIQTHIHDNETIMKIADDFDKVMSSQTGQPALPAGAQKQWEAINDNATSDTPGERVLQTTPNHGPLDFNFKL